MPDVNGSFTGDTECVNSSMFGDVETYLTNDVPQFMQKNFNAPTSPAPSPLAGLSEGGTCATFLALNNPKEYPTFASYSGFTGPQLPERQHPADHLRPCSADRQADYDAHDPQYLLTHQRFPGMAAWFESAGLQDTGSLHAARACDSWPPSAGHQHVLRRPTRRPRLRLLEVGIRRLSALAVLAAQAHPAAADLPAHCATGTA